jgi:hypothetical protein
MAEFALTTQNNSLVHIDPAAVAAGEAAKARIQSGYIMAFQKPRDIMEARDRILKACKRSEFAGKAEYSKPVGKTSIKGPSIRFAELALREWGNIMTEVTTLYEDENLRRVRISALDLETNAQFTRDIQIKKTVERKSKKGREEDLVSERKNSYGDTVFIVRATDEEMYTKESAWVSKVLRNEGLRLIPTDIIEEGMTEARKTVAERATKDPEGEKKRLLDAFSSLGIGPKEVQKYIRHPLDTISPPELVSLRTVYQSIRDGESTWGDYAGEEMPDPEPINTALFDTFIRDKVHDTARLAEFIGLSATTLGKSADEIKNIAQSDMNDFWKQFTAWEAKKYPPATQEATKTEQKGKKGKDKLELRGEAASEITKIACPSCDGALVNVKACTSCSEREKCPAINKKEEREPGQDG